MTSPAQTSININSGKLPHLTKHVAPSPGRISPATKPRLPRSRRPFYTFSKRRPSSFQNLTFMPGRHKFVITGHLDRRMHQRTLEVCPCHILGVPSSSFLLQSAILVACSWYNTHSSPLRSVRLLSAKPLDMSLLCDVDRDISPSECLILENICTSVLRFTFLQPPTRMDILERTCQEIVPPLVPGCNSNPLEQ